MNYKIELTREELTTILQVATGNVKDFVMDNDKFINKHLAAINYTHSCKSDSKQLPKRKRECTCSGMSDKVKCDFKCYD